MVSKAEQYQRLWHEYERETNYKASGTKEVVDWAIQNGKLELPKIDPRDFLAKQMAQALREEMATDDKGRRFRKNHAMKIMENGVQTTIWGVLGYAPENHMRMAFTQRREQIIGDCLQLKTDVDVYNDLNPNQEEIQLLLDFTDDVAEREIIREDNTKSSSIENLQPFEQLADAVLA
jgi:hypothetical protein